MSRKVPVQSTHYCKTNLLTRKGNVITWPDAEIKQCRSISTAKRFMRIGQEGRK